MSEKNARKPEFLVCQEKIGSNKVHGILWNAWIIFHIVLKILKIYRNPKTREDSRQPCKNLIVMKWFGRMVESTISGTTAQLQDAVILRAWGSASSPAVKTRGNRRCSYFGRLPSRWMNQPCPACRTRLVQPRRSQQPPAASTSRKHQELADGLAPSPHNQRALKGGRP